MRTRRGKVPYFLTIYVASPRPASLGAAHQKWFKSLENRAAVQRIAESVSEAHKCSAMETTNFRKQITGKHGTEQTHANAMISPYCEGTASPMPLGHFPPVKSAPTVLGNVRKL